MVLFHFMSNLEPEQGPENIDSLLASVEAGSEQVDVIAEFAHDYLEKGLNGLALQSPEGIAIFKGMYGQMWDRVAGIFFSEEASWRQQSTPKAQLGSLVGSIWDLKDSADHGKVAVTAFGLAFCDQRTDGSWGEIFGDTSYYGKNELQRLVESICIDCDFIKFDTPQQTALFIMNYIYTIYTHYAIAADMMGSKETAELVNSLMDYLESSDES